uniref:exodeoxyribonuclease III n=1 Tax=Xiphophorus maculatus TaxID=8083 RepID=A0A3B5QH08_XIPMA
MSEDGDVTGFRVQSGRLFLHDSPVETVPIDDLLTSFIDFLRSFRRPVVLAAHNVMRFDAPVLTRVMKKYDLFLQFQQVVSGFLDTFLLSKRLFPGISGYSQVSLVRNFLGKSYDAHNAEEDAKMLQELYNVWRPDQSRVMANTFKVNENKIKSKPVCVRIELQLLQLYIICFTDDQSTRGMSRVHFRSVCFFFFLVAKQLILKA